METDENKDITPSGSVETRDAEASGHSEAQVKPVEITLDPTAATVAAESPRESLLDKGVTVASQILSTIFSPLLTPTYAIILIFQVTVLQYVPAQVQWLTALVAFALTGIVPLIVICLLYAFNIVTSTNLERRKERIIPYSATFLGYCGLALYLYGASAPEWMWLFVAGGAAGLLIVDVVNLWWKISAHAAAMGGVVGLCFFLMKYGLAMTDITYLTMAVILIAGLVCTTRLVLNRHTLWQIAAGFAVGAGSVLVMMGLRGTDYLA